MQGREPSGPKTLLASPSCTSPVQPKTQGSTELSAPSPLPVQNAEPLLPPGRSPGAPICLGKGCGALCSQPGVELVPQSCHALQARHLRWPSLLVVASWPSQLALTTLTGCSCSPLVSHKPFIFPQQPCPAAFQFFFLTLICLFILWSWRLSPGSSH